MRKGAKSLTFAVFLIGMCGFVDVTPTVAQSPDPLRGDRLFAEATAAYDAGDFRHAVRRFEAAAQLRHSGAQAMLAQLLWKGAHVPKDDVRALALAFLAIENATPDHRMEIEDIYQMLFCSVSPETRTAARQAYAHVGQSDPTPRSGPIRSPVATRNCVTGEAVVPLDTYTGAH